MTKILRTIAKWFFIGVGIILFFWFAIYNVSKRVGTKSSILESLCS